MLVIARTAYDEVIDHAREGAPAEVCGVLGGEHGGAPGGEHGGVMAGEHGEDRSRALVARRADNVAPTPETAYEIDPERQLAVMEEFEDDGLDVVGFYHSHPRGPPGPSATDVARATWRGYSYVIVYLGDDQPRVGSWRWDGEVFEEEAVRVA